jgi:hypothetical protein
MANMRLKGLPAFSPNDRGRNSPERIEHYAFVCIAPGELFCKFEKVMNIRSLLATSPCYLKASKSMGPVVISDFDYGTGLCLLKVYLKLKFL